MKIQSLYDHTVDKPVLKVYFLCLPHLSSPDQGQRQMCNKWGQQFHSCPEHIPVQGSALHTGTEFSPPLPSVLPFLLALVHSLQEPSSLTVLSVIQTQNVTLIQVNFPTLISYYYLNEVFYFVNYTSQQDFGTRKVYCVSNVTFHAESKHAIKIFPPPTVFVQWPF